ncbi:XRE family transcriptional regulator [Streptosporangium sp. NPDC001681]|uniref:XRE family transcriptional regulator n=1 Tax=Streptosporangium sp. NPDC001681 TaxID=3154395 RepID=UPI0033320B87
MAKRLVEAASKETRDHLPARESIVRNIKNWEAGKHRPKDPYPKLYARAFGLDEAIIFDASPNELVGVVVADPGLPWVWEPGPIVSAIYDMTRSDLMLDRRQAIRALSITAGLPLIDPVQRWLAKTSEELPATSQAGRIGVDELARLETTADVFRTWGDSQGGGLARKAVIGQLNEVADLLRDSHPRDITVRLFHVMAKLAKIAATMSWDCGMQTAAQKYYILALQAAKPAKDWTFGASVLASMARQLLYLDRPQDALELVRLALDGVQAAGTHRVRAMLHTREAWAYAALGRPEAFRRATDKAEDAFGEIRTSDLDPEWITYFDAAELAGVTGGRYLEMSRRNGQYAAVAVTHIGRALELRRRTSMRSLALDQVGLAQAHLRNGDLDEAVTVGSAAADTAGQVQSDRVRVQLRELHAEIAARREPVMAGLSERIRETLAG